MRIFPLSLTSAKLVPPAVAVHALTAVVAVAAAAPTAAACAAVRRNERLLSGLLPVGRWCPAAEPMAFVPLASSSLCLLARRLVQARGDARQPSGIRFRTTPQDRQIPTEVAKVLVLRVG